MAASSFRALFPRWRQRAAEARSKRRSGKYFGSLEARGKRGLRVRANPYDGIGLTFAAMPSAAFCEEGKELFHT